MSLEKTLYRLSGNPRSVDYEAKDSVEYFFDRMIEYIVLFFTIVYYQICVLSNFIYSKERYLFLNTYDHWFGNNDDFFPSPAVYSAYDLYDTMKLLPMSNAYLNVLHQIKNKNIHKFSKLGSSGNLDYTLVNNPQKLRIDYYLSNNKILEIYFIQKTKLFKKEYASHIRLVEITKITEYNRFNIPSLKIKADDSILYEHKNIHHVLNDIISRFSIDTKSFKERNWKDICYSKRAY